MMKHLLDHRARLPRLGKIRLGVKKVAPSGKSYPAEVPYFVLPDDLKPTLGDRPTAIPVLFPVDDPARLLVADYMIYGRGQTGPGLLLRRCDGEQFREWPRQGGDVTGACRKTEPFAPCPDGCRAAGVLHVIVLDGPVGIWQVVIGGEQRLADLAMELEMFRAAFGRLTNIAFELVREETTVQVRKETGERLAKVGWPVHIRCRAVCAREALAASGQRILALPAAPPEEAEDEAVPDENGTTAAPAGCDDPEPKAPNAVDWDISMCYAAAAKLGVTRRAYDIALERFYGRYPEGLPQEYIDIEMRRFLEAGTDPAAHAALRRTLLAPLRTAGQGSLLGGDP